MIRSTCFVNRSPQSLHFVPSCSPAFEKGWQGKPGANYVMPWNVTGFDLAQIAIRPETEVHLVKASQLFVDFACEHALMPNLS